MINDLEKSRCLLTSSLKMETTTSLFDISPKKKLLKAVSLNFDDSNRFLCEINPA